MCIRDRVDVISAILPFFWINRYNSALHGRKKHGGDPEEELLEQLYYACLLYTSSRGSSLTCVGDRMSIQLSS